MHQSNYFQYFHTELPYKDIYPKSENNLIVPISIFLVKFVTCIGVLVCLKDDILDLLTHTIIMTRQVTRNTTVMTTLTRITVVFSEELPKL